mgnify:FL=1
MADRFKTAVDVEDEDIHWSPEGGLSYASYLNIDQVLSAQATLTHEHDEMMFIIVHQASELWLKLCLHELDAAIARLSQDQPRPAMKMLARIARVQEQLTQSWAIMATMTPADYLRFRDSLGQSSGFQSHQYRRLEYRLGNKNPKLAGVFKDEPERHAAVLSALNAPSLYDETLRFAARAGLDVPEDKLERDWAEAYQPDARVEAMWRAVYLDTERWWEVYEFAEKLVDLEQKFAQWRFNHMKTVERIIGFRRGTGGSGGVSYLVKALDLRLFPELWTVRTEL